MKLKDNINYSDFLNAAERCAGEVFFRTAEGDILNLKSRLSSYVFLSNYLDTGLLCSGELELENESDRALLAEYLVC